MGDKIVAVILDCILMLGLGAIGYQILFAARKRYRQSEESLHWTRTEGVVTVSSVKRHDSMGSSGSYETANIHYEYAVDGKKYKSTRFSFDDLEKLAVTEDQMQSLLARYPNGKELTVYYDPNDHASAILFPKVTKPHVVQIYRIVGLISSIVAIFFAVKLILDIVQ